MAAYKLAMGSEPVMPLMCMFPAGSWPASRQAHHCCTPKDSSWLSVTWPECAQKMPLGCRVQTAVTCLRGLRSAPAQTAL